MNPAGMDRKNAIIDRFRSHVSSGKADFFKGVGIDFVFGRREGPFVWDATSGKRLINCHCNGGVFNLGHRHAEVIAAMQASLLSYDIGNHHLISEPRSLLAEQLAHLGSWQWNIQDDSSLNSDEVYRLLGLEPQQIPLDYAGFLGYIHPDDRTALRQAIEATLLNEKPFRMQYRALLGQSSSR